MSLYFLSKRSSFSISSVSSRLAGRGDQYGHPWSKFPAAEDETPDSSSMRTNRRASWYGVMFEMDDVPNSRRMLEGVSCPVTTRRRMGYLYVY